MHLYNAVSVTLCLLVGQTFADVNWDYGNWAPVSGSCATCFEQAGSESRNHIRTPLGISDSRGREFQLVPATAADIQPDDNSGRIQLVYLPEGSLDELRSAHVARVEGSQLRPVRETSFQNFQQLPSFRDVSPKRPTSLIIERGSENEAQQQIQLLEAALNSQHENVLPGELPRVFIAPTHIPPPPGYVKIPLLPSQSQVQARGSLPRTFLTSEFHSQLPQGFVQLPLPDNVAHLSHDIPFVHPDSNPLLLAHFSPASTLRGSPVNQRIPEESSTLRGSPVNQKIPEERPNQFLPPNQETSQFPSSIRQQSNLAPKSVQGSNHFATPVEQPVQSTVPVRESNQVRISPSSALRQPNVRRPQVSSVDSVGQNQNFGTTTGASAVGFSESNFGFNRGFDAPNFQTAPNTASQSNKAQDTNVEFTSDPFIQPNELRTQQTFNSFQQPPIQRQPSHRFQIGAPVILPTNTFSEDRPLINDSGFKSNNNNNNFGFQENKPVSNFEVQEPVSHFGFQEAVKPEKHFEIQENQQNQPENHFGFQENDTPENNFGFQENEPLNNFDFQEDNQQNNFEAHQDKSQNSFGLQEEKPNSFNAPQEPSQSFVSPNLQKNQRERLVPKPVSNDAPLPDTQTHEQTEQFNFPSITPAIDIVDEENHFFGTEPTDVLTEATPSPFKLTPIPVNSVSNNLEHQLSPSPLPEFDVLPTTVPEEKEADKEIISEAPEPVRNRGRKRLRPQAGRGRGRHVNRNRLNANAVEEQDKESLQFTTSRVPEEIQTEQHIDDKVTSAPVVAAPPRTRIPARRQRPSPPRVSQTKPEIAETNEAAEETTLFPPFAVAREKSNKNNESEDVEATPLPRKDASLRGSRFGSRVRSNVHERNEVKSNVDSVKSENALTEEAAAPPSISRGRAPIVQGERSGARNAGRPVPEWLKNRRRTRVLSRVRKVHPSDEGVDSTPETQTSEADLKGAESARFSVSQAPENTLPRHHLRFESFQTEEPTSSTTSAPVAEVTPDSKIENIFDILHLDSTTDEIPMEAATIKYFNDNENLPVVELQDNFPNQKTEEDGYVDTVSKPTLLSSSKDDTFVSEHLNDHNREIKESNPVEDESIPASPFDSIIDFVSHTSSNSNPQVSSSFISRTSESSDLPQNFESRDINAEDPIDSVPLSDDHNFDHFFDVSSTDDKPRSPDRINSPENSAAVREPFLGSSAHIVYAVALGDAPTENLLPDDAKLNPTVKNNFSSSDDKTAAETTTESTITTETTDDTNGAETSTPFIASEHEQQETTEPKLSLKNEIEMTTVDPIIEAPSNASTLNFLESFFSNKSRPAKDLDNEVRVVKGDQQTIIGESTVTEVRSSAPVICFSEGNCISGSDLRKKRDS